MNSSCDVILIGPSSYFMYLLAYVSTDNHNIGISTVPNGQQDQKVT